MSMKHWWNDTRKGKLKYFETNLPQCHFARYKSTIHIDTLCRSDIGHMTNGYEACQD